MSLNTILKELAQDDVKFGTRLSDRAIATLTAHRRTMGWVAGIVFAAVLVGVVIAAYVSIRYVDDPTSLAAVVAGMGLSLGAALTLLQRTWKEWSQANLLLILISEADEARIAALIDKLIDKV